MTNQDNRPMDPADLRQKAEALARDRAARTPEDSEALTSEEIRETLHELRVHQIELEMQNEELRTVQAEIEAGRDRYVDLYDLAPMGYCTLSEQGLILEANLTVATLLGTTRGLLIKQPISSFILKDDQDIYYLHRKKLFETGEPQECELRLVKPDGALIWAHLTGTAAQAEDGAPLCRVVISDITGRKRTEALLADQKRRLQALEKHESLKRMTGSIAHLFNNHLAVVIGNLELLSGYLPSGAIGSENLREAQTAARHAAETSGLMLTFLGQSQGKPVLVDLIKACRQLLAGLEVDRPMGAEIRCELPDSRPVIRIDRFHLDQIISALVTNAWESLGKAGEIRVSINSTRASDIHDTHRFPLDWEPKSENYACLRVADTGCGMNDTTIGRIFDPFFTDKFTGRGLGLSVVLGIVRASEGCVTVDSEPGRGSVFQVMWPLSSEDVPGTGGDRSFDYETMPSGGTILLVDDQEIVRKMAKAMINHLGFDVLMAKDGKEAVTLFSERHQSIRLVLTDLTMPQLNGWDTLEALRRIRPDIPVIMASGYDANFVFAECQGEQPQAFLSKPYRLKDLKRALARALGDIAED